MLTVTLTYRNRGLNIVKKCLDSLQSQTYKNFKVVLVDYGSELHFSEELAKLVKQYSFIKLIQCPVQGQLWNKSRAINIALKQCDTFYFLVGDIDMMYRNDFVEKLHQLKNKDKVVYFQVGFLSEEETKKNKTFDECKLKHISGKEATGMTMYPAELLQEINGYDEYYHGWGAEDSDVHRRVENLGKEIYFYTDEVLIIHQWHPRNYRTKDSLEPFHTFLEQINHAYYQKVIEFKKIKANLKFSWGEIQKKTDFKENKIIHLTNEKNEINAFFKGVFFEINGAFEIHVLKHQEYKSSKNELKKIFNKKYKEFYSLQELNDLILLEIITHYRNSYYEYEWNKNKETILLKIQL